MRLIHVNRILGEIVSDIPHIAVKRIYKISDDSYEITIINLENHEIDYYETIEAWMENRDILLAGDWIIQG